jgi:hypothetical protein
MNLHVEMNVHDVKNLHKLKTFFNLLSHVKKSQCQNDKYLTVNILNEKVEFFK